MGKPREPWDPLKAREAIHEAEEMRDKERYWDSLEHAISGEFRKLLDEELQLLPEDVGSESLFSKLEQRGWTKPTVHFMQGSDAEKWL